MCRNYKRPFRWTGHAVLVSSIPLSCWDARLSVSTLLGLAGRMGERARFRCKGAGGKRASRGDCQRCSIKYGIMRRSLTLAGVGLCLQKNDKIVRIWVIGWCEWRMMRLLPKDWETYLRSSFSQAKREWLVFWVLWLWVWRRVGVLGELERRICFNSSS